MLLHTVNTVAIATTLGDYDGGLGPSQPEREYKKSTQKISGKKQLVIFSLLSNYTSSSYNQRWQHAKWRSWRSYGGYEKKLLTNRFWLAFYLD